jgi:anti-sigma regulatory factor (Ser/Thr protein kinase)
MTDWPLRSHLELGALPSAVPCARLHAKHVLWEWGLESFSDSVGLVVSELTTNAVAASAGLTGSRYSGRWQPGLPPVRLSLYSDKERVLLEVWDGDDRMPVAQGIDLEAESGRGLLLVESLCSGWGAYIPEGASGKVVWAVLDDENLF